MTSLSDLILQKQNAHLRDVKEKISSAITHNFNDLNDIANNLALTNNSYTAEVNVILEFSPLITKEYVTECIKEILVRMQDAFNNQINFTYKSMSFLRSRGESWFTTIKILVTVPVQPITNTTTSTSHTTGTLIVTGGVNPDHVLRTIVVDNCYEYTIANDQLYTQNESTKKRKNDEIGDIPTQGSIIL